MKNQHKNTGHFFISLKKQLIILGSIITSTSPIFAQNSSYDANTKSILGTDCAAFGYNALFSNNATGNYNTGIGTYALTYNSTGDNNTAIGNSALAYNTTGSYNTAGGYRALLTNVSGDGNTAFGHSALYSNTGYYNSAFGLNSLYTNSSGNYNSASGYNILYYNTTGSFNTGTGYSSLNNNTTGNNSTATGAGALAANTTGNNNTGVGFRALFANTVGSNNTAIGYYANMSTNNDTNATVIGSNAIVNSSRKVRIGNVNVATIEGQVAYSYPSDGRFKKNISEEDVKGLAFIKLLRPVVYNFETQKFTEFLTKNMPDSIRKKYLNTSFEVSTNIRQSGFIAQEVEKAAEKAGYNFNGVHKPDNDNDNYSIAYSQFVVPLVKAVQEQQKMIEDQKAQLDSQKQIIDQLLASKSAMPTGINELQGANGFVLEQNIPNPFTSETTVKYTLTEQTKNASLIIYDLSGKQITSMSLEKGTSSIKITSEKLVAGIYIYSVIADGKILDSKRMVVANK